MERVTLLGPKVAACLVLAIAAACGGDPQIYEVAPREARTAESAQAEIGLPEVVPAVPVFVIRAGDVFSEDQVARLERTDGVAVAAPVALGRMKVDAPHSSAELRIAVVDPGTFRSVAPPSTRDADFVWGALLGGTAVVTHDAAARLGLDGSEELDVGGAKVHIGALADNGRPNIADLLVSGELAGSNALTRPNAVVVGAASGVTVENLARRLRNRVGKTRLERLVPRTEIVTRRIRIPAPAAPLPVAAGLHPVLAEAVQELIVASNGRIWLVSGYRDHARQTQLWEQALRKYRDPAVARRWVAPPGRSMHEHGLAVDLGGDLGLAVRLVQELGLPLWRPLPWEPWHFELVGSRG